MSPCTVKAENQGHIGAGRVSGQGGQTSQFVVGDVFLRMYINIILFNRFLWLLGAFNDLNSY